MLADQHPNTLRPLALHYKWNCWDAWGRYTDSILTGRESFSLTHGGTDIWTWFKEHPKQQENFNQAMRAMDGLGELACCPCNFTRSCMQLVPHGVPRQGQQGHAYLHSLAPAMLVHL